MAKKSNKRYAKPQFACPICRRTYYYQKECSGCHVMTIPREPTEMPEVPASDMEQTETLLDSAKDVSMSDLPTREDLPKSYDDPTIDMKKGPKKSLRENFNAWADNMYGFIDEGIRIFFPDITDEQFARLQFSTLEKVQVNNFVYLILKRWFPSVLDAMSSNSVGQEDASIVNIVFAGAFAVLVLFRKFRVVSELVKLQEVKDGIQVLDKLPPQYQNASTSR